MASSSPASSWELGRGLIREEVRPEDFEPERYADEYRERALAMIEKKAKGQEIKAVPSAPRRSGQVVDIFAALKKSLETAGQQKATPSEASAKGRRKGRRERTPRGGPVLRRPEKFKNGLFIAFDALRSALGRTPGVKF